MNWKFTAVFLLAGLTACAHNDISSTNGSTSSASSGSAATDSGGSSSSSSSGSYSGGGSGGSSYGGSAGYGSPTGGYGGSAMGSGGTSCDAQSVQNMIGKTLTNETTEQAYGIAFRQGAGAQARPGDDDGIRSFPHQPDHRQEQRADRPALRLRVIQSGPGYPTRVSRT